MKNKIQKFSKGNFRLARPEVVFEETNLVLIIGEGEVFRGSFLIKSSNESAIRGLIYPSSFRVHLKDSGFDGNPARVEFTYDGRGLPPGHVEEGKFTVVCTGGEYELSFTAIVEKPYVMTAYGKVQNTDDFRKLAIKDYSEAARLFRSRDFYSILKYENERIFYLYDNMRKWSLGEQALEEFLVGIKQKECIFLTLPGEGMLFEDIDQSTKGVLTLLKNTWGYMPVHIETEGRFLKASRTEITTEEFVGNTYEVEYYVRPEFLHGGRNYGAIKFVTPYETLIYEVEVLQNQEYDENHHVPELLTAQITKEYISYVAGRIELKNWVESAIEKLLSIRKIEPQNELYQLIQAHVYIMGSRIEEAKWILENYNYNRFAIGKDPITNCYYLFLTALIRGNRAHTERVLDEIGKTYLRHQDSWILLYMLLKLDPKYRNPYKRLEVLEQQYEFEVHSVLFYLEVYLCYQEKPTLLKKLGDLETHVLNFATKHRLITKEAALYVANIASQRKEFGKPLFRILERIYNMYSEVMILNTICTLLIKAGKTEKRYFVWYQRAVDAGLRIARLYEYYMITLNEKSIRGALPRTIFLYFMHGNSLDYKKAAFLYANLLTFQDEEELYLGYREQMVKFTWDQLEKRHISESLRVLYKRFCTAEEMDAKRMEAMRDICYSYGVTTKVPNMKCVLVIEKDGEVRQRVPYNEKDGAVIHLYDRESRIVWESMEGRYYTDSIVYETDRLFYEPRFMEMCREYADASGVWQEQSEEEEVTFEKIKEKGISDFDEKEVFRLCSAAVRDTGYKEEDFLTFLCFEMFKREQYDKATLLYLANYYCGATRDMKHLWKAAHEYGIPVYKLGERIITQMVFSENLFGEEKIFEDYYLSGNAYFRLKQAYLAFVSREYVLRGRNLESCIFRIIAQECDEKEELTDVCKIALLDYYAGRDYPADLEPVLHQVLREMCEKQLVLPSYMRYKDSWLREVQLYDKVMIFYHAKDGSKVKLFYKIKTGKRESLGYQSEILIPVFENIYVKQFVLYDDEVINYYIEEINGKDSFTTEKEVLKNEFCICAGKFGRINEMMKLTPAKRKKAMIEYEEELLLAEKLFKVY
ncbi:DUF5717 family protein [Lachnospiraceae bacterium 42-17]|nr:hypothetical protein [Dorea sp.]